MSDLISRQAAMDAFLADLTKREEKNLLHTWTTVEVKYYIAKILEQLPTVDAVPKEAVFRIETFDEMHETYTEEELTLEEMLDKYTDEGYPYMEVEE